jgi:nitroimidazol reductase NimA-like FMN-containing flavoprotein (pyridoxamine 5'-phosphate oxidase superfamily)
MLIDEGFELLSEHECIELLARERLGRVGVTVGGLPVILPVNYAYCEDGDIVFRTSEGTKLHAATERAIVAFEVDWYDLSGRQGWSVLVIGRASAVCDEADVARLEALGIAPWADAERRRYVRVRPEMITGRRIAEPAAAQD